MFPSRIVPQGSQQGGDRHDDQQNPVGDGNKRKKKKMFGLTVDLIFLSEDDLWSKFSNLQILRMGC